MNEPYLTWAEIEKQYANEWVLIADPTNRRRSLEVTGGRVVLHCADRAEFLLRVSEGNDAGCTSFAVRYAGKFPEEEVELFPVEPEAAHR